MPVNIWWGWSSDYVKVCRWPRVIGVIVSLKTTPWSSPRPICPPLTDIWWFTHIHFVTHETRTTNTSCVLFLSKYVLYLMPKTIFSFSLAVSLERRLAAYKIRSFKIRNSNQLPNQTWSFISWPLQMLKRKKAQCNRLTEYEAFCLKKVQIWLSEEKSVSANWQKFDFSELNTCTHIFCYEIQLWPMWL